MPLEWQGEGMFWSVLGSSHWPGNLLCLQSGGLPPQHLLLQADQCKAEGWEDNFWCRKGSAWAEKRSHCAAWPTLKPEELWFSQPGQSWPPGVHHSLARCHCPLPLLVAHIATGNLPGVGGWEIWIPSSSRAGDHSRARRGTFSWGVRSCCFCKVAQLEFTLLLTLFTRTQHRCRRYCTCPSKVLLPKRRQPHLLQRLLLQSLQVDTAIEHYHIFLTYSFTLKVWDDSNGGILKTELHAMVSAPKWGERVSCDRKKTSPGRCCLRSMDYSRFYEDYGKR